MSVEYESNITATACCVFPLPLHCIPLPLSQTFCSEFGA